MPKKRTTPTPDTRRARRALHLRGGEFALKPDWRQAKALVEFLSKENVQWRTDPVLQCVIVSDAHVAEQLQEKFHCTDETAHMQEFLAREQGVRVAGCDAFGGMLAYSLEDDVLYHVDAISFTASPVPDINLAYTFKGLGRPAHRHAALEYDSLPDAIEAFKRAARKAQKSWLRDRERHVA